MKKSFTFILFLIISYSGFSQTKIDFVSKYLFTTEELGPDIKVLTDSVVFKHENSIMFCDSALFNYTTNYFDAFGNIRLIKATKNKDTVYLYGDTLHYSGKLKYAKVRNNVILEKDSLILFTDSLDYDLNKNMGYYFNKGVTLNGDDTLKSIYGYFYADDNEFFFKDNVEISNPDFKMFSDTLMHNTDTKISYFMGPTDIYGEDNYIYCENGWYNHNDNISQFNKNSFLQNKEHLLKGDSLHYDKNTGIGKAFKNVTFKDTAQNILLLGEKGFYNEKTGFALMTDSALFIQVSEETDSMFMHADTLRTYKDSILEKDEYRVYRMIQAYHHVKTYKSDFQSKCDSLVYDLKDSIIEMHVNPVMWADSNQLSADYIVVQTYRNEVDRIDMFNNAFIISQSDSVRFNQINGKDMIAYIEDKELYQIDVIENGKAVYFIRDDSHRLIGVNLIECTNMELYFKDNKMDKIWFFDNPVGTIHPPFTLNSAQSFLQNFKWDIAYRPETKLDIFIWKKDIKTPVLNIEPEEVTDPESETEEDRTEGNKVDDASDKVKNR